MFCRAKAPPAKKNVGLWGREWVSLVCVSELIPNRICFATPLSSVTDCSNMEANKWSLGQTSDLPMNLSVALLDSSLQQKADRTRPPYMESEISITLQGQQTVQAITQKATVLFSQLQAVKLNKERVKLEDHSHSKEVKDTLDSLKQLFLKLRRIYEECKKRIELPPGKIFKEMIPIQSESNEKTSTSETDFSTAKTSEYQELELKLKERRQQVKELIDKMRSLIWDINIMLVLKTR